MRCAGVALAVAVAVAGCAVGGSSSVVGRWSARRVVDSTACVQSQAPGGGCEKRIEIGRDLPARRFSSLTFVFPASGYVQQRGGGEVDHGFVADSYFEYVRGRGGLALGVRVGAEMFQASGDKISFLTPVSVVGHAGGLWGSVYVGGGYSPVALAQRYVGEGEMRTTLPPEYFHNSVHVFAGTRFWLRRTLERGLTLNPELRVQRFGDTTLAGVTGNIGVHF